MVLVEDYSLLGIGETKQEALRSYRDALKSKGNFLKIDESSNEQSISGTVLRVQNDVSDGRSN